MLDVMVVEVVVYSMAKDKGEQMLECDSGSSSEYQFDPAFSSK